MDQQPKEAPSKLLPQQTQRKKKEMIFARKLVQQIVLEAFSQVIDNFTLNSTVELTKFFGIYAIVVQDILESQSSLFASYGDSSKMPVVTNEMIQYLKKQKSKLFDYNYNSTSTDATLSSLLQNTKYKLSFPDGSTLNLCEFVGEGNFAKIISFFSDIKPKELEIGNTTFSNNPTFQPTINKCLKIQQPKSGAIEHFIMETIPQRLSIHQKLFPDSRLFDLFQYKFLSVQKTHFFKDGAFHVLEYTSKGTLLDLINFYKETSKNGRMDEVLALYYAIEILNLVSTLHKTHIIHADIKPDNFLLLPCAEDARNLIENEEQRQTVHDITVLGLLNENWGEWKPKYKAKGWEKRGLKMIDFGRSLDVSAFVNQNSSTKIEIDEGIAEINQELWPNPDKLQIRFVGDLGLDGFGQEILNGKIPFSYGVDYLGICGTLHTMLFGEYMKVVKTTSPQNRTEKNQQKSGEFSYDITKSFSRYFKFKEIWKYIFDVLLNNPVDKWLDLDVLVERMENALMTQDNNNSKILQSMMCAQECKLFEYNIRKRKIR